jgi:hypothetical protein
MRTRFAVALSTLVVVSGAMPLSAQARHEGGSRPSPVIPHEPMAREPGHAAPLIEPGRPPARAPYVRDDHWYGHAAPDDPRFHLEHPFQFGHFGLVGPSHLYAVSRFDLAARHVWLPGGMFEIADWDWPVTTPWCWTCDQFVVYLDPDHPGWYLLYDVRMGEYVHAELVGS